MELCRSKIAQKSHNFFTHHKALTQKCHKLKGVSYYFSMRAYSESELYNCVNKRAEIMISA